MLKAKWKSGGMFPQKMLRGLKCYFTHCLGETDFLKKINFGKGQNVKNINKNYFNFLSYNAGVNGNVRHTLTSLAKALTVIRQQVHKDPQVQSRSKRPTHVSFHEK